MHRLGNVRLPAASTLQTPHPKRDHVRGGHGMPVAGSARLLPALEHRSPLPRHLEP